ncbi:lipoate--protein ligase family protein [Halorubrum sp. BV1]|uniref:lipoate--protein ligase family protein n=1 Tax=Halorubrum sp. BV1 TaxID=1498500 RepID=UPI000679E18F|nr:lipoate--protein ligase family protein [Halorubrum sp. BV1]
MDVFRSRADRPVSDRSRTDGLLASAAGGTPALSVWRPPGVMAFGRRDVRDDGFDRAAQIAESRGFQPIERDVGGRAVAYPGETLAFAHAVPIAGASASITDRYERATETLIGALRELGADVVTGEPEASFCPGEHSIRAADGGKLAGLAQRVRADAALVSGCVVVTSTDADAIAAVTEPVYDALSVRFDPASIGSVAAAGGPATPDVVARAVEDAFADGPWGSGRCRTGRVEDGR